MRNIIFEEYNEISYQNILDSFEFEILKSNSEGAYCGDTFTLFKNKDKFGYLIFGWGSCSGCDALYRCDSKEELDELQLELFNSIKWFDSKEEASNFFNNHDFDADFNRSDEFIEFCKKYFEVNNADN